MSDADSGLESAGGDVDGLDPAALAGTPAEPDAPKRRGRKPRADAGIPRSPAGTTARAGKKAAQVPLDLSAFSGMLIGISTMLALRTGIEEIEVGADEMNAWLGAAQKVARHYSVETTQKTLDWVAFVGITGQVFGTRALAVSIKARQQPARRRGPAVVHDFPQPAIQPDVYPAE